MGNNVSKGKEPVNKKLTIIYRKIIYSYLLHPQSTICDVNYKDQSGTGELLEYGCKFPKGTWRTLFITSNHS